MHIWTYKEGHTQLGKKPTANCSIFPILCSHRTHESKHLSLDDIFLIMNTKRANYGNGLHLACHISYL